MKYNIYYKGEKINQLPLTEEELKTVYKHDIIYKKTGNGNIRIPVSKIVVSRCINI